MNKSYLQDLKIGTIDLETYTVDLLEKQEVYTAGWLVNNTQGAEVITYYLDQDNCFSSQKIVQNLFNDIFKSNYHNYTFYIHNLSNFDSKFNLSYIDYHLTVTRSYIIFFYHKEEI